jgi:DNA uptake protein ComE-like DNA-binding protein
MHVSLKSVHSARQAVVGIVLLLGVWGVSACNNPPASDQQLQEQAAKATEGAKRESAEALAQTRVAAANAERAVNDVAAGVKQGLDHKGPAGSSRLDLNTASEADLAALPGISVAKAAQIRRHRPYASSHDLVKSGILTERQFDEIAPKVTAE